MYISPPCVFNTDTVTIEPISNSAIELLGIPTYTSSSKLKQVYYAIFKNLVSKIHGGIASYGKLSHWYTFNNISILVSVTRALRLVLWVILSCKKQHARCTIPSTRLPKWHWVEIFQLVSYLSILWTHAHSGYCCILLLACALLESNCFKQWQK